MSTLYVIDHHDQLLQLWRSQNALGLRIAHFDFHCDMRGLLVDRQSQQAFPSNSLGPVDEGNFMTHAIKEGRVASIRWFHHVPGGRQYDVGTIRYTTDFTAQPLRWFLKFKRSRGIPLHYEVAEFSSEWSGLEVREFLDIDWDFFAANEYPLHTVAERISAFFSADFKCVPEQISVCYSPRYSHASRDQFEAFIERLAKKFGAKIVRLPSAVPTGQEIKEKDRKKLLKGFYHFWRYQVRHLHYEGSLWLRQRGIY